MATSGETSYVMTGTQIITMSFLVLKMIGPGETPEPEDFGIAKILLNTLLKAITSDGIQTYLETEGTIFLEEGKTSYIIGGSNADRVGREVIFTELSADEASGQTILSVDDTSEATIGDVIGITLDDGTIHWTDIVSFTSTTITVTDALTDDASDENRIFIYTRTVDKPLKVYNARIIDSDGNGTPMSDESIDNFDYYATSSPGTPYNYVVENKRDYIKFKVTPPPSSDLFSVNFRYQRTIENIEDGTDDMDIPQEHNLEIIYILAVWIADFLGKTDALGDPNDGKSIAGKAATARTKLLAADSDRESVSFAPDIR